MRDRNTDLVRIREAMATLPATFGLRAFPGDVFRVCEQTSYVNDSDVLMLYTEVLRGDKWLDFAKGTVRELTREVVQL